MNILNYQFHTRLDPFTHQQRLFWIPWPKVCNILDSDTVDRGATHVPVSWKSKKVHHIYCQIASLPGALLGGQSRELTSVRKRKIELNSNKVYWSQRQMSANRGNTNTVVLVCCAHCKCQKIVETQTLLFWFVVHTGCAHFQDPELDFGVCYSGGSNV